MKVTMIDCTGMGSQDPRRYAANILLFSKETRLNMSPGLLAEIELKPESEVDEKLDYIANTIPSSWEFIDYTMLIEGVSRAFTHQLVRTRTGSYAQQTMRVLNVSGFDYYVGPTIADNPKLLKRFQSAMNSDQALYDSFIEDGAAIEDSRGVLPIATKTNILVKFDLRTAVGLVRKRTSPRTQGEYRDFIAMMKTAIRDIHPWADMFFDRTLDRAAQDLDAEIEKLDLPYEQKMKMIKLVDQMRGAQE